MTSHASSLQSMDDVPWRARHPLLRRVLLVLAVIAALCVATVAAFTLIYPPQYVWRLVTLGESDVGDIDRFPSRPLHAAAVPHQLERADASDAVQQAFTASNGGAVLDEFLASMGTQAFIVIRRDKVIYERYFDGVRSDTLLTSFSMAKSVVSDLIGCAIAEGKIRSVDDPITRYLPELAARDARFAQITIRHLLKMSSGIRYEERHFFDGDDAKTYYYPYLRELALRQTRIELEPGTQFHYNNYHPLLLGLILERATGTSVTQYLQEKLWTPLGMEYDGSWSLDSQADGLEKLESGVNARAIDFAKLGLLMLHEGRRDGVQILPPQWVREATSPPAQRPMSYHRDEAWMATSPRIFYSYMWWGLDKGGGRYDFTAVGKYAQLVFVSPSNEVVIVRNGTRWGIETPRWITLFSALADRLGAQ